MDNPAFEETVINPGPLGIDGKFARKGFGEQKASEETERVLQYNRRDHHLDHVSCPYFNNLHILL